MNIQNAFLVIAWLITTPFTAALDAASSSRDWQPPAPAGPPALDTAHLYAERLHERWVPPAIDWTAPREFAINMVYDLGLITLAVMDCHGLTAAGSASSHPAGVLILSPLKSTAPGGGPSQPDFHDLRRRPIEERMHSI